MTPPEFIELITMRSLIRALSYTQIIAAVTLGISYFLPIYRTAVGEVRHVDEWGLFFWVVPVLNVIYKLSNRWLKAIFCFLSAIGGLLILFMLTFLATFKSTPMIGYSLAKTSFIFLVISWLIFCVVLLFTPRNIQIDP